MAKLLKIGIVGCGAIGSSLAKAIVSDFSHRATLVSLYDVEREKAYKLAHKFNNQKLTALNLDELINKVDLVIEASKAESVFAIAQKTLTLAKDIMIMSVGGILGHYKELERLARQKRSSIFIPSGAICGIDGLKAANCGKIKKVTLTTQKPLKAFLGSPYVVKRKINLAQIYHPTVLFKGKAVSAIKFFPQNVNVAATLSIAGIGPDNTAVRIVASPNITQNIHEIEIESDAGKIVMRVENVVHPDNPKTSYLAILSAIATLKQILSPIKVGT